MLPRATLPNGDIMLGKGGTKKVIPMRPFLIAFVCLPTLAAAQDAPPAAADVISFTLGFGAQSRPAYFGADENTIGPTGSFSLQQLEFGPISRGGGGDALGLRFKPSIGFVGARRADDYDELDGLEDIDFSFEVGGGISFTAPDYEVFAKVRQGVSGHEALVAEVGGDVFYRPTDALILSMGPRVLWGSDDYAQTYFGVTSADSLASSFDAFDASAGIVSAGVAAEARYQFNDTWGVTGKVSYDQLRDDAADSPITESDDQIKASVVLTRRITLGF